MAVGDTPGRVPHGQVCLNCSPAEIAEPSRAWHFVALQPEVEKKGLHPIWVCCAGPKLSAPGPLMVGMPRQMGGCLSLLWLVSMEAHLARNQVKADQLAAPEWALPY